MTKLLLPGRVLLKPFPKEAKIGKHIVIPEYAQEFTHRATVMAVGEGKPDEPMVVKEGDVVLYSKDRYFPFELNGETYFIVMQEVIHAVL